MSIVAHTHPFVVGVDTHARNHVYAILDASNGAMQDTQSFPTSTAGINRAIKWVTRRTNPDADTLWVIEGGSVLRSDPRRHRGDPRIPRHRGPAHGRQEEPRRR